MTFAPAEASVYEIRERHGYAKVREMVPADASSPKIYGCSYAIGIPSMASLGLQPCVLDHGAPALGAEELDADGAAGRRRRGQPLARRVVASAARFS